MHFNTRLRALAFVLLAVAMPVSFAGHAAAHMGSTKYVSAEATDSGARVVADIDLADVAYELGISPQDEDAARARSAEITAWLSRSMRVTADGSACAVRTGEPTFRERDGLRYVSVTLDYACGQGTLVLTDDAVFEDDPRHESIVRLAGAGDEASALILRTGSRTVDLGQGPTLLEQAGRFFVEGAIHLFTGYDHILFLLTLLLVAGEAAARDGLRRAIRDVAIVVTGFTAGHSVTLIAAALDVVVLPSQLVESAIALSIVIVAVWNIAKPEQRKGLPWVAAAFGLIHGFGFSSVLREIVLPSEGRVVSLLAFNVGIEVAQLAIVLVVLGPLAWAAERQWYRRFVVQYGSASIAVVGAYWFVTRALG